MIDKMVSHYKITEKLGEGGMGVVYKAEDTRLDRSVALKFLPPNLTTSPDELARFEQEAKAVSALNHPNIETIYDVDEADGRKFIVLEYIPGGTLKSRLKQLKSEDKSFSIKEVLDCALQMAEGLAHAHKRQIIHRDIKTENIMLTDEGKVKLTDFGLAKLRGTVHKTKTGSTLGTLAYMSPEQIRGEEVDHRSDIFSFGVVLYEILTSHLPFQGEYEAALSYSILNEHPRPVRDARPDAPQALEKIISRCLEKDKTRRFQHMEEITAGIRGLLQEMPSASASRKKNKLPLWIGAGLVLLALAILAYYSLSKKTSDEHEKSIAVLPFVDMSPQRDQEYFCDGMTEELINRLSRVQSLRVPARTSAFAFKGKTEDIRDIGGKLKVRMVLEGSVRKAGSQLRVTAQLINVEDGYHIWSETYNRELEDVFSIQDGIASAIVNSLKIKLTPEEIEKLSERPIDNVRAYECYLKARRLIMRFDEKSLDSALVFLRTALDIMGDNGQLYAGMASVYSQYANIGIRQEDYLEKAEAFARKALSLQPNLAIALSELGFLSIYQQYPRNLIEQFRYQQQALQANPNEIRELYSIAISYSQIGRPEKAQVFLERSERVDPLNPYLFNYRGYYYLYSCRFEAALEQLRLFYQSDSSSPLAQNSYATILVLNGKRDEALAAIDRMGKSDSTNVVIVFSLMLQSALLKDKESTIQLITSDFRKTCWRDFEWSYWVSDILSLAGAMEEALDWLENAISRGFINYPYMQCDPFLNPIRGEESFKKLMVKAKYEWEHFKVPE
ncbi:protein kinase [bacterium]|nr:protein kinase [bacterium]